VQEQCTVPELHRIQHTVKPQNRSWLRKLSSAVGITLGISMGVIITGLTKDNHNHSSNSEPFEKAGESLFGFAKRAATFLCPVSS